MPKEFDLCRKHGGQIRTIKPREDVYIHVCFPKGGGPSVSGKVRHNKKKEGGLFSPAFARGLEHSDACALEGALDARKCARLRCENETTYLSGPRADCLKGVESKLPGSFGWWF